MSAYRFPYIVVAHELGHNFGLPHTAAGIMGASAGRVTDFARDSQRTLCNAYPRKQPFLPFFFFFFFFTLKAHPSFLFLFLTSNAFFLFTQQSKLGDVTVTTMAVVALVAVTALPPGNVVPSVAGHVLASPVRMVKNVLTTSVPPLAPPNVAQMTPTNVVLMGAVGLAENVEVCVVFSPKLFFFLSSIYLFFNFHS